MDGFLHPPARLLLRLARRRDPHAFSELVGRIRPRLERMVRALVRRGRLDAEDLLQESLVHAYQSLDDLRADSLPGFQAWFAGIVRHRLGHAMRRERERVRPRRDTTLPWSLQLRHEPELLEALPGRPSAASTQPEGLGPARLVAATSVPRIAFLLREGYGSDWGTVGMVVDRGCVQGLRRVVRQARRAVGARVSA